MDEHNEHRCRRSSCLDVRCAVSLALTVSLSVTLTVTLSITLTMYLLSKLNLQVTFSNQPPIVTTTNGGTCCQFNLHVSNQSPSVITTNRGSCCDSRDDGEYKKRVIYKRRDQRLDYERVYPVYERYPRPKRVRRRAPPPPCMPCWGWGGGMEGEGPY